MQRMAAEDWDTNRAAFAYLVALDPVCRDHIRDLYDFEDGCIHSDALAAAMADRNEHENDTPGIQSVYRPYGLD